MGYDLFPLNKKVEPFRFGCFTFPIMLEALGSYYPSMHSGGYWVMTSDANSLDSRYPKDDDYPILLRNDGFRVTKSETKVWARMIRNYMSCKGEEWSKHFVNHVSEFLEWLPKSGGFRIR